MALDVGIRFDTTGSMYPIVDQVRYKVESVLSTLFKEIPDLRMSIGGNGDYGDRPTTVHTPLTTDIYELTQMVRTAPRTHGFGNGGEAYEVVLNEARFLNWRQDATKVLVMISDEPPHTPTYYENKNHLDWRVEAQALADMGVVIITVQCLSRGSCLGYYKELPARSSGYALELDQFPEIVDLIMAVMYRQKGLEPLEAYEATVQNAGRMNRSVSKMFDILADRAVSKYTYQPIATSGDLVPVAPGRFQILEVGSSDQVIKAFVEGNGLPFKTGRGFYEFTKREEIQEYKEVVLRDRNTGDMYSGDQAKRLIGLTPGIRQNLTPGPSTDKYDIFIQSTSFNRKLKADTRFLYEVDLSL